MRAPFLLPGIAALVIALWGGLVRTGWAFPIAKPEWVLVHGPLMVCAFLGTVISLERAVGVGRRPGYLVPTLVGLGSLAILFAPLAKVGPLLLTGGSAGLVILMFVGASRRWDRAGVLLVVAAATWLAGNLLWIAGRPVSSLVPWWLGFLVLTIAAERLELTRFRPIPDAAHHLFAGLAVATLLAMAASTLWPDPAFRALGGIFLTQALWLLGYDIARVSVKQTGLPRFVAVCLLSGYVWLAAAGLGMLTLGNPVAGPVYDALLHAIFVGFVFSMIFGHAPIIFPAVLGLPIRFRPVAYGPLVLLHLSLGARVGGDLGGLPGLRKWGALINAITIVAYFALTIGSLGAGPEKADEGAAA